MPNFAARVREALLLNPFTDSYEIAVGASDGRVSLNGTVDTHYEEQTAERVASGVKGVAHVNNWLEVVYTDVSRWPYCSFGAPITDTRDLDKSDAEVRNIIESELFWSPFVDSDEVEVEVENGVASLDGTVDTWREYYAAEDNAWEGGAISVLNNLDVR